MAIKRKEGENLSKDNILKVISLLEGDNPVTKKVACEMLNISYNTTRLAKIIQEYKDSESIAEKLRKELRGKPISIKEKREIINKILSGESLSAVSESTFRSINVIKNVLKYYNIPVRLNAHNYFNPIFLEDNSWKDEYNSGDLVFSARYNRPCTVVKLYNTNSFHGNVYSVEFHGVDRFYAYQPAYELADLTQVQQEFDIVLEDMPKEDVNQLLYEAYLTSKKLDK